MQRTTDELYGSQSFEDLVFIGCIEVYNMHIAMLEAHLKHVTADGDFNGAYKIQKAQQLFRDLRKQAEDNCGRTRK